jgi:tRNA modification GTPase
MSERETIAAIATPTGRGGIGIIRVSGVGTDRVARALLGRIPQPRIATFSHFKDPGGQILDSGIALYFPAPSSFTGEDVLELQGHGGIVVMDLLLKQCLLSGARLARPGEFTERAFHNKKLDLAQAEAVADLINSSSEQAARSAQRSLQGEFSRQVSALVEQLISLRVLVESAIDFPEEEIDFLSDNRIADEINHILDSIRGLMTSAIQGRLVNEGMVVVLAGLPNAGKSSLLNALAQTDRAIVSDTPGTTRDTIEVEIQIDGMPVTVVDTAGLRVAGDGVESEGVRRTHAALKVADHALYVVDDSLPPTENGKISLDKEISYSYAVNKIDLSHRPSGKFEYQGRKAIAISATDGRGIHELREHLKDIAGYQTVDSPGFIARTRHLDAIQRALEHLTEGREQLVNAKAGELLAEELRLAQRSLSEITGDFSSEQLLGRIFASFCIGK